MSHAPHADANDPFQKRTAVTIALLTTILAFANMLTNQARTEAILSSNRATNKWSYYQSKSTKQQLVKLEQTMLARLPPAAEGDAQLAATIERYEVEKEQIRKDAEALGTEEREAEHKEHFFEYAATLAELAIILASIALLMTSRKALMLSLAVAFVSVGLVVYTSFLLHPPPHVAPPIPIEAQP